MYTAVSLPRRPRDIRLTLSINPKSLLLVVFVQRETPGVAATPIGKPSAFYLAIFLRFIRTLRSLPFLYFQSDIPRVRPRRYFVLHLAN